MVLDTLSSKLKETLKKVANAVFIDEKLINELVKDIQRALLSSDVNVKLVFELTQSIKERALKDKPPKSVSQKEFLIKIVYEELVKFLGEEKEELKIGKKKPFKVMMLGLFGSGKTTSIGKLGNYYKKRGYKIAAVGLDVHRPASMDQLEQNCKNAKIDYFIDRKEKDPIKIYDEFKDNYSKYDVLFVDTAGRDRLNDELIEEIEDINNKVKADERLLVISADLGQAAKEQAEQFHKSCDITGIVLTKLDGTAKGGGALTAAAETKAKIKFIGVGEKINDIEVFNPKGFVGRILGMGDLEALLEKVKVEVDQEKAQDLGKKFLKGDFNFLDLYEQVTAMKKLGPLNKIMEMVPGMGNLNIPKDMLNVQQDKLGKWKFMFQSMTKKELEEPESLNRHRIDRIAKGSGVTSREVRELLKQYKQSKKVVKMMKGKDPEKLMKKFKGKIPGM